MELDERGRQCFRHYQRCRAVYWQVPDALDPLVEQHAAVIHEIEDLVERRTADEQIVSLGQIIRRSTNA